MAFAQQAQQQAVQTRAQSGVAVAGEVEVVVHVVVTDGAVGMHKPGVGVQEGGVGQQRHLGLQQCVDPPVLLPQRVGVLAPWEQALVAAERRHRLITQAWEASLTYLDRL